MTPRLATLADVPGIAKLHVQAWDETYTGLLPQEEFDHRNLDYRLALWGKIIASGAAVSYLPKVGFGQIAKQRDETLRADFPNELYSFYTLQSAHGSGAAQALLRHAIGETFTPFTAEVLQGNARATAFYEKIGGQPIAQRSEDLHGRSITNIVFGWLYPVQLHI